MVKVSVIVPVYGTEKYLEKSLKSLVNQTLDDMELILVDNGASDECRLIMEKFSPTRSFIKIIHLKENIGYSGALNKGLEVASGEYVGFCDSDDWVDEDYYEKLYFKAKETNADIVYTCYKEEYDGYEKNISHRVLARLMTDEAQKIRALLNGAVWNKIYRRESIETHHIRFPVFEHSYSLDNAFLLKAVLCLKKMILTDDPYYHYVQRQTSEMHKNISVFERTAKVKQLIGFVLADSCNVGVSYQTKYELMAFLARSLGLGRLVERDEIEEELYQVFSKDEELGKLFKQYCRAVNPSVLRKMCSVQNCFNKRIFWILGFKITLKTKEIL